MGSDGCSYGGGPWKPYWKASDFCMVQCLIVVEHIMQQFYLCHFNAKDMALIFFCSVLYIASERCTIDELQSIVGSVRVCQSCASIIWRQSFVRELVGSDLLSSLLPTTCCVHQGFVWEYWYTAHAGPNSSCRAQRDCMPFTICSQLFFALYRSMCMVY